MILDRSAYGLKDAITRAVQGFLIRVINEATKGEVFFVQVGANDGVMSDPLHEAIIHHDWRGALIEPVPLLFEALRRNYAGRDGLSFHRVACAETPGALPFYQVRNIEEMTWTDMRGTSSFSRDLIRSRFPSDEAFDKFVEQTTVEVVTLDNLLQTASLPRVDLVLIDTEGADHRVMQGFDVERHRPKLLMIEHAHLSAHDRAAIYLRMTKLGYRRFTGVLDSFFYHPAYFSPDELQVLAVFDTPLLSLS
jgi:FkbM family methyltransferase